MARYQVAPLCLVFCLLGISLAQETLPSPPPLQPPAAQGNGTGGNSTGHGNYTAVIEAISHFLTVTQATPFVTQNKTNFWAPRMIRLAWHSSASWDPHDNLGGPNGATMRFYPESNYTENLGLDTPREQLDAIKQQFPWISYSDLWTLAGCVAVRNMGGPRIMWRPGRVDKPSGAYCPPDGLVPDPSKNATEIRRVFNRLEMTPGETVAVIGAHAVGGLHRNFSGYEGQWTMSPQVFDNQFFTNLVSLHYVPKNYTGPFVFNSVEIFQQPFGNRGKTKPTQLLMLPTDMALKEDTVFWPYAQAYAQNQTLFFEMFASAFQKLLENGADIPPGTPAILV